MKNLKKVIAVICVFAVAMGMFSTIAGAKTVKKAAGTVKITMWDQDGASTEKILDKLIADFMAKNPDITVKRTHLENEALKKQFITASLGTDAPDIALTPNDFVGIFSLSGAIVPVDTVVGSDSLKLYDSAALDMTKVGGKVYMLPDRNGNDLCFLYNKKIVATAPKTFEDVIKISKSLKASGKVEYGLVFNQVEPFFALPFLKAFGGQVFDDMTSQTPKATLDTPAMTNMLTWLYKLKTDEVIPKECDYNQADSMFKQGKAAFSINGPWSFSDYAKALGSNFGIAVIPSIAGKYPAPFAAPKGYVISKNVANDAAKKDAVKKLLLFLTNGPSQVALVADHNQAPTIITAMKNPKVLGNKFVAAQIPQLAKSIAQPTQPEIEAIWTSTRVGIQQVLAGKLAPDKAGASMQKQAEGIIADMK